MKKIIESRAYGYCTWNPVWRVILKKPWQSFNTKIGEEDITKFLTNNVSNIVNVFLKIQYKVQ